jgi:hypothetical protein
MRAWRDSQFRISDQNFPIKNFPIKKQIFETTTGEARALSYPGSPTTFKKTDSAN